MDTNETSPSPVGNGLERGVLSGFGVLAQPVANLGPSAVIAVLVGIVAGTVGAGAWLTWLIGTVVLVLVAISISFAARRYRTTGGLYSLMAKASKPGIGYLIIWMALTAVIAGGIALVIQFEVYFGQFINLPAFGVPDNRGSEFIIGIVVTLVAAAFSYLDVRFSARFMLAVEGISISLILALMIVTLLKHSGGVFQTSQLRLQGVSTHQILLGVILTVFAFAGFETATMLGTEARNPGRSIPVAVAGSVAISGVLFVFVSYTMFLGFTGSGMDITKSESPLMDLSVINGIGWYRYVVNIGVLVSMLAVIIAVFNAGSRLLFTLSREGLAPHVFERLSRRQQTPAVGLAALAIIDLGAVVVTTLGEFNPVNVFVDTSTLSGYGSAAMYILTMLGIIALCVRQVRVGVNSAYAVAAAALVGGAGVVYVLQNSFHPWPVFPSNVYLLIFCGAFIVALLSLIGIGWRSPHVLSRVGSSVVTQSTTAESPSRDNHQADPRGDAPEEGRPVSVR